jgi:uncharacterized SAM-binding protein YcdF (DUF218 family)
LFYCFVFLLLMKRSIKTGIVILSFSFAGLLYAHIHFCYNTFYKPAHFLYEAVKTKPLDVIIVPGISYNGGNWNFIMKWRVHWSVFLYKTGITKNVIYSGGAVYSPYTEAVIMALYAERLGIPKDHIFTETRAEHTTENLYYSWKLAKEKGFQKIAFATDPFQSMKIEPYISKFKVDVVLLPMVISFMRDVPMKNYEIESYKAYDLRFKHINDRETKEEQEYYSKGGRIDKLLK